MKEFLGLCRVPGSVDLRSEQILQALLGSADYRVTLDSEYWFCLYEDNEILAECSAMNESKRSCFRRPTVASYSIWDVFVPEKHRGNKYSLMLLLNVIDYFDQRANCEVLEVDLQANSQNWAARKIYDQLFDLPGKERNRMLHYNLTHVRRATT